MKRDLEEKLLRNEGSSRPPSLRFVTQETFNDFARYWEKFLLTANDEMKKKIVQKFIRRIEVGQNDVKIHWLVDEEHYQNELNLRSNSPVSGENGKISVVGGSYSLINGAIGVSVKDIHEIQGLENQVD